MTARGEDGIKFGPERLWEQKLTKGFVETKSKTVPKFWPE